MCGIVGILLAPHRADPRRLVAVEAMAANLTHRGPDGSGVWIDRDAGIALGHRRLAIVDLTDAGHQPMLSHGDGLVMTFNGEVYNFAEIRPKLEALGHTFRGHSDTEVMLAAFESFGVAAALGRFAGMFALGLWDRRARVLHLIRDRMGKKPLYVAVVGDALLFASELKALRAYPGFAPTIDARALAMVLRYGWVPERFCIWQGVFKLPPGTMLSVTADELNAASTESLRARVRPWWSLAQIAEAGQQDLLDLKPPELEVELHGLLRTVVRERMLADVPLGAFLSGGIDSTSIVALMQAESPQPVRTFTIGFREERYDEACYAAQVARHLGTEHTEFRLTPAEALAVIPELPRVWDEPFADESQIPTLLLSRLARQYVTVALSGDGGDECFGGYARHFMTARFAPVLSAPSMLRRAAASALRMLRPNLWDELMRALPIPVAMRPTLRSENLEKCARVIATRDDCDLYDLLTVIGSNQMTLGPSEVDAIAAPPLRDAVSHLMYRDMMSYLPGDILVKVDRASMATSLEVRSPFLDHRLIAFAWRLPTAVKVRGAQGKWLLRRMLRRYLPEAMFERPKQGFNVPVGEWLVGPLRNWAQELLDAKRIRRDGLLDDACVQACWQEHLDGRKDHARELWAVLMVQAWLEETRSSSLQPPSTCATEAALESTAAPVMHMRDCRYGQVALP